MSNNNNNNSTSTSNNNKASEDQSPGRNYQRRASFSPTGSSLSDFFGARPPPGAYPGPITSAAAQANQRRRLSVSAGVTGTSPVSPTSPSWRRESFSSASSNGSLGNNNNNNNSSPFDEDDATSPGVSPQQPMGSSFSRRMSFGARALRDAQTGRPLSTGASVLAGVAGKDHNSFSEGVDPRNPQHQRRQTVSQMPPPNQIPNNPPPTPAAQDSMGERMLKGDFYMD